MKKFRSFMSEGNKEEYTKFINAKLNSLLNDVKKKLKHISNKIPNTINCILSVKIEALRPPYNV